jgi:hypothetical protein
MRHPDERGLGGTYDKLETFRVSSELRHAPYLVKRTEESLATEKYAVVCVEPLLCNDREMGG